MTSGGALPGARIRALVLDIDGVLTDGRDAVSGGDKRLFLRDLDALTRARGEGMGIAFLTGESEGAAGPVVERCGGGRALYGMKDKVEGMSRLVEQLGCTTGEVCYVADGERDAPALELVGLALAPSDASAAARAAADRVLASRGGGGAVEEAIALVIPSAGSCGSKMAELVRAELKAASDVMSAVADVETGAPGRAAEVMAASLSAGGKVVLFGNGASAEVAQHAAARLVARSRSGQRPLPAIALTTGAAFQTALDDDFNHEEVFERQVAALVRYGDVAVGMSTSGRSVNVARALAAAGLLGARTIALVGAEPGTVGDAAELCLTFPVSDAARIEQLHLMAFRAVCAGIDGCVE